MWYISVVLVALLFAFRQVIGLERIWAFLEKSAVYRRQRILRNVSTDTEQRRDLQTMACSTLSRNSLRPVLFIQQFLLQVLQQQSNFPLLSLDQGVRHAVPQVTYKPQSTVTWGWEGIPLDRMKVFFASVPIQTPCLQSDIPFRLISQDSCTLLRYALLTSLSTVRNFEIISK